MTRRRLSLAALSLMAAFAVCACGSSATASPPTETAPGPIETTAATTDPDVVTLEPEVTGRPVEDQTDTEWGRIWDRVPSGFPVYPRTIIADELASGPASATYAGPEGDPEAIAMWFQDALEQAAFSTEALSGPLEDGSFVIDSVGQERGCALQVTIAPLGGTIAVTVLYGAECPID